eukprot:4846366-Pyramimonas_sp.AAC.2
MARSSPPKAPTASAQQATMFSEIACTEIFRIKSSTGKTATRNYALRTVKTMIDGATRYHALRTVKSETAEELIKAG